MNRHLQNTSNPHKVTAAQVGLDKVKNVSTNDQTPTYTAASTLTGLTSGEKLSVAFGKISRAITDLISHVSNRSNPHKVTASQAGARADDWVPAIADIGAAPSGYGLGSHGTWVDDLNLADKCGYYSWTSTAQNTPFDYGNMIVLRRSDGRLTQIGIDPFMVGHGGIVIRHYTSSQWLPWEWVNPPMRPGVEYRTTERYNDGKVVYATCLDIGSLPNSSFITVELPNAVTKIVDLYGTVNSTTSTVVEPFPHISFSTGAILATLRKSGSKGIVVKTFTDETSYAATVAVKYTKN